jgi:hypothetical protein
VGTTSGRKRRRYRVEAILSALLAYAAPVFAQENEPAAPAAAPGSVEMQPETQAATQPAARGSYGSLGYVLAPGLLVPLKHGPAISAILRPDWTLEAEYLHGTLGLSFRGLNLVSFHEELYLGRVRWYPWSGSFNAALGAGRRKYAFKVGDEVLDSIASGGGDAGSAEVRVWNNVAELGIGNRWRLDEGFTFGLDWLDLLLPLGDGTVDAEIFGKTTAGAAQRSLTRVVNGLTDWPTFCVLKLYLGWTF